MNLEISEKIIALVNKIIETRKEKGFSLENMAMELEVSTSAYNKIEKQETKLTVERVFQIQEILGVSLGELLEVKGENIYNQSLNDQAVGHQEIQNLYQDNRDLTDKFISSLTNEVTFLRAQLERK